MLHWITANWHPGWVDTVIWIVCLVGWYREGRIDGYHRGYKKGLSDCPQAHSHTGFGDYLMQSVTRRED